MIDEDRTLQLFGYTSDELKPKSNKLLVAICEECGRHRYVVKYAYRELCPSCARKGKTHSLESRRKMSEAVKKRYHRSPVTDDTRRKMSEAQKNKPPITDETRRKLSEAGKNRAPPTDETRIKLSQAQKNRAPLTEEQRRKMSEAQKNKPPITDETRRKLSEAHNNPPEETRRKVSATLQGIPLSEWVGYAKERLYCEKFNESCRERNREKYGRRCFLCGKDETDNGSKLSVHHVDMNKDQGCNDYDWSLVPLCKHHHATSHNDLWEARIVYLLDRVWLATL